MKTAVSKTKKFLLNVAVFSFLVPAGFASAVVGSTGLPNPLGSTTTIMAFVERVLQVVIQLGAVVAVFFLIYAGFLFIKASGNPEAIAEAKKTWNWTAIGIMVLLGAQVIAMIIKGTLCQIAGGNLPGLGCS